MPSMSASKLNTKKGVNGFTSKSSSKDPSDEQPNGSGTKRVKGKRKMRSQKRAWRWRVPKEEPIEDGCAKCQYVSRRIGIACDNIRPHSKLSSMGLCERHTQFAQQLKAMFIAEQSLSDQGDFIAHRIDEDGMLSISDDDETLSATFDWPCSEENLHYDPTATGNYCSLLANTEVITEKELLMCRLAALESRMAAIKEYREVLAEKQRRYEAYLTKEILEEAKKGQLVAETRKEKRQMRILRASKRYGHWRNWKASKLMRQQLEARLRATPRDSATDTGPETQFDYLDVELENEEQKPTCSFIYVDENSSNREDEYETKSGNDSSNVNENDGCREVKGRQCGNVALPGVNYCIQHVFENCNQQMFAACLECGAAALDLDDGDYYCFTHISMKNADRKKLYGPLEVKTSFDYSTTSTPPSSVRASLDSASNLAQPSEGAEQILSENLLADKEGNCTPEDVSESHRAVTPTEFNGLTLMLNNLELKGSDMRVQYDEDDPNAPPVQIVLIDNEEDGEQSKTTQQNKEDECTVVNVVQRHSSTPADPTFGVDSLGIVATRRALITPRRKVDDGSTLSAARTRPFIPTFFPHSDSVSKHRKQSNPLTNTVISPQRYITIEQRTHTEEGLGQSQMTIQKLRTGGSYLHSDIQKHGPRITSTPSNSNLMPSNSITAPVSARSVSMSSGGYHASTSISRLTDPNTISLSSSPITQMPQPVSQPKRSAVVQRNAAAIMRSRQMLTSQLFRQSSTSSTIERPSYSMAGSSSTMQRWRPQRSSTVTGSGGMQNSYRYSKIDANDRMLPQRDYDEYYYRPRETKMFNVSGSARSRLVPVDPSPTMYYVRPQYQTYTPLSLSRPMRRYQQEGESVRRVSLPREVDRQQLQETAAAVASIAPLNEPQSEQHQGSEETTESTLHHSNVLVAAPQVNTQKQETEQVSSKDMLAESEVVAASNPSNEPQQDDDSAARRVQASCPSRESDSVVEGNANAGAVSQKYCNCIENAEDGLAVLAMAAASHAAAIDHHQIASSGEPLKEDPLKEDDISKPSSSTFPLSSEMHVHEPVTEPVKSVESSTAPLESSDKSSVDAPQAKRPRITSFGLEVEDEEY